jgi:D-alanyl-D-alanine carboxypeptidase
MDSVALASVLPQIQARVGELAAQHHQPGVAAGIVNDQELAWSAGFGFADLASERRPDQDTLFRVGSITKTFTATAIMQIRDQGKLRLDDPLVRHIPEFSAARARFGTVEDVTLRRLLTHRSGLVGEPPLDHWQTLNFPSVEEMIAALPNTEVVIAPDSAFKYSNLAFALLGEVVARVSGRPYVDYVQSEILAPLGMNSSTFAVSEALRPRLATGYDPSPFADAPQASKHPIINGMASAGQLYSSVADLAKWVALQFRTDVPAREGEQVLAGRSVAEMHQPNAMEPNWDAGYCLSWMGIRRGDNVYLGHGGGIHGFITQVLFNLQHRVGAIVLTNSGAGVPQAIALEMLERVLPAAKQAASQTRAARPVTTPAAWLPLLGYYSAGIGGMLSVQCRGGVLILATPAPAAGPPPPPVRLSPTDAPDAFLVENGRYAGEVLRFRHSADGTVTGFSASGFAFRRLIEAADSSENQVLPGA